MGSEEHTIPWSKLTYDTLARIGWYRQTWGAGPSVARLRDRHLARPRTWRRLFRRLAGLAARIAAAARWRRLN